MKGLEYPFRFGTVVSGELFYDRRDEAQTLHDEIAGGQNVVLYAPRRYGKTSLAMTVAKRWKREGLSCIYFDLMRVESLDDFMRDYANVLLAVEGRTERGIRALLSALASVRPRLTLGDDGRPSIEIDFGRRGPSSRTLAEVLSLSDVVSSEKKPLVIVLDEFQEVATLSRRVPVERIFRSVVQHQEHTRYVFLGSKTHLLHRMFDDRARPFYRSATPIVLGKPRVEETRKFLLSRFRSAGMTLASGISDAIIAASGNIPYYLQAVALRTWASARSRGDAVPAMEDVDSAMADLVAMHRDAYDATAETLSETQRRLLSAIAHDPVPRFDADWRARHFLPGATTLNSAAMKLLDKGILEKGPDGYFVPDPFHVQYLLTSVASVL